MVKKPAMAGFFMGKFERHLTRIAAFPLPLPSGFSTTHLLFVGRDIQVAKGRGL